jgi:hypothetical protein
LIFVTLVQQAMSIMEAMPGKNYALQSRARADCALFASCGSGALETAYFIRDG